MSCREKKFIISIVKKCGCLDAKNGLCLGSVLQKSCEGEDIEKKSSEYLLDFPVTIKPTYLDMCFGKMDYSYLWIGFRVK